jgi:hypothetical protein
MFQATMFQAFRRRPGSAGSAGPRPRTVPQLEALEDRCVPAVIGGTVYNDANNNGILNAGEAGIPNSTLELHDATTGALVSTAVSDANGQYRFLVDQRVDTTPVTQTVEATFAPATTNAARTQAVAQFDPSQGQLTSIDIIAQASLVSDAQFENLDPEAEQVTATLAGTLTLQAPSAGTLTSSPSTTLQANLPGFDGTQKDRLMVVL